MSIHALLGNASINIEMVAKTHLVLDGLAAAAPQKEIKY